MTTRRRWAGLLLVMLLAVGLRAGVIWHAQSWRQPGAAENRQIAKNLVAGDGFSFRQSGRLDATSVVAPVYPFVLAGLYATFGDNVDRPHQIALGLNLLFAAATVPLVFQLTRLLLPLPSGERVGVRGERESKDSVDCLTMPNVVARSVSPSTLAPAPSPLPSPRGGEGAAAWIAALLFALWPTQIFAATLVQPLVLAVALTFGVLLLAARATRRPTIGIYAALGAAAGGLTLVEGSLQLVALCVVPIAFVASRRGWARLALGLLAFAIVVGPWLGRNFVVHGRFVPVEAVSLSSLTSLADGVMNLTRTVLTDWLRPGIPAWYVAVRGFLLAGTIAGALVAWRRGRRDVWVVVLFYFVFLALTSALLPVTARTGAVLEVAQLPLTAVALAWLSRAVLNRREPASLSRQQTGEGRGEGK